MRYSTDVETYRYHPQTDTNPHRKHVYNQGAWPPDDSKKCKGVAIKELKHN